TLERIQPSLDEIGVSVSRLIVENVSLPAEVEAALDRRASMGVVGDLRRYAQFQAAEALRAGGGGSAGADIAGGLVMARQMETLFPPQAAAAPPPPPPPAAQWHVAIDGARHGPMERRALREWAAEGRIGADALVWRPGFDGWRRLGDVAELASADPPQPPPLPPKGA
ncbi:MAG: SPFH domain-containing protein, partial [Pseudomonadota bacterium]